MTPSMDAARLSEKGILLFEGNVLLLVKIL